MKHNDFAPALNSSSYRKNYCDAETISRKICQSKVFFQGKEKKKERKENSVARGTDGEYENE